MDKKNIIIIVLSIACIILGYMAFKTSPLPDNSAIIARIDSISVQTKKVLRNSDSLLKANLSLRVLNDSLLKLSPKIKTKYVSVYKQIDKLDNRDVKDTLGNIFRENHIDTTKGDTMIYISPVESKFLIKEHYRNGELTELMKVSEEVNHNLTEEVKNDSLAIGDLKLVIKGDSVISLLKENEIQNLNTVIKSKDKKIVRQKVFKWLAIVAGAFGAGYLSYLRLMKR